LGGPDLGSTTLGDRTFLTERVDRVRIGEKVRRLRRGEDRVQPLPESSCLHPSGGGGVGETRRPCPGTIKESRVPKRETLALKIQTHTHAGQAPWTTTNKKMGRRRIKKNLRETYLPVRCREAGRHEKS